MTTRPSGDMMPSANGVFSTVRNVSAVPATV